MKPTIYGERFAYKYKDNIISRPTIDFHELYLINYALEQANIKIPTITKLYNENWKILTFILQEKELNDTMSDAIEDLKEQIKNTKKLLKKTVKRGNNEIQTDVK